MSNYNDFKHFLHRHNIKVLDTNKRFARYSPTYSYFTDSDMMDLITSKVAYETEPLYTLEIPESEIRRIQEFEDQVFGNMKQQGHYNLFQNLMEMKEEEAALRRQYPAVQKAYEKYSLMLNLCKSGKGVSDGS